MTERQLERSIAGVATVIAMSAIAGSAYGLAGASGVPLEWLERSPFNDYRVPSLILGIAVCGSSAMAAVAASRADPRAEVAAVATGGILTTWIAAQVLIIGPRSFLQPVMAGVGAGLVGLGLTLNRRAGR